MNGQTGRRAFGLALLLCIAAPSVQGAVPPPFGGWRSLDSRDGAEPALRDVPFALLPADAPRGTRYAVLDREGKRVVCCLRVASSALDDTALRKVYQLPDEWVMDLRNQRSDRRPWEPHVFEMRREGELASYVFDDAVEAYSEMGGLLLPPDAKLQADGTLTAAGQSWQMQFRSTPLGDDSSALDRFTLQPAGADGSPLVVEVSYGTY